jgi:hypothetical protein
VLEIHIDLLPRLSRRQERAQRLHAQVLDLALHSRQRACRDQHPFLQTYLRAQLARNADQIHGAIARPAAAL